jgi:hypothetical protein
MQIDKKTLRKFGLTMAAALLVIAGIVLLRHKAINSVLLLVAAAFFGAAVAIPTMLKPVYILWMRLALVLSWANTRLILLLMFYLIFTPIGLALRLIGKDLLGRRIEKGMASYWAKKEKAVFRKEDYERQF